MATKKKTRKTKAKSETVEVVDPRAPLAPTPANLTATLKALEAVLPALEKPEEPEAGDLVAALLHITVAEGLPCGIGQEARRRFEAECVDRNELRVTEAYELERMLGGLDIPDLYLRCARVHESVGQVYNDQNHISLDELREGSISERKNFFARISAIEQPVVNYLHLLLDFEELIFSQKSTTRVETRLGLDSKNKNVGEFLNQARALLAPFGHLPLDVGPHGAGGKPVLDPELSPASLLIRLGPDKKR